MFEQLEIILKVGGRGQMRRKSDKRRAEDELGVAEEAGVKKDLHERWKVWTRMWRKSDEQVLVLR